MRFEIVPVTALEQNCSILWCEATRKAAVVDPGGDVADIEAVLSKNNLTLEKVFVTHGHCDHAGGAQELADRHAAPIEGPQQEDAFWIELIAKQGQMYGMHDAAKFTPTRWLEHGDTVTFGNETLEVLHCPGHTPGHVVFFHRASGLALVGDVLFRGSIGRTDFPRGDYNTLISSIRNNLFPLGDEVRIVPGHGPMSTLGEERRSNPYVADQREDFRMK